MFFMLHRLAEMGVGVLRGHCLLSSVFTLLAVLLTADEAWSAPIEEVVELPVEVHDNDDRLVSHRMTVTIFRDGTRAPSPFLILNHGRVGDRLARDRLGRVTYESNARYLVALGFAAFVPTRVGYGVTGGPDVERAGGCPDKIGAPVTTKRYAPVFAAAAEQVLRAIAHARSLPYVDPERGVVMGQSFGGATYIAVAARQVPGVLAAVNFAGGGGGRTLTHPRQPCRPDLLTELFRSYGARARIPTLWLYSDNDQHFGRDLPRIWFKAFTDAGGQGQFVALPSYRDDGHGSFTHNPTTWRPALETFLRSCCSLAGK
jgi:dienelactone hydrolase